MSKICVCVLTVFACCALMPEAMAQERPTFNRNTADPRPDILPYWLTDWHTDYRQQYNRPRYVSGRMAHIIEPTSQEAMVWCEAKQMGLYDTCKHPPVYKSYMHPKPWETLPLGPRPDFKKPNPLQPVSNSNAPSGAAGYETSPSDGQARELSEQSSRK